MGASRSAPCTNLLLPDNACNLMQCSTRAEVIKQTTEQATYLVELLPKTKFLGLHLGSVLLSRFHSLTKKRYLVHLCTFIKQVTFQKVCSFLVPVYSLGFNCQEDKSQKEATLVVVHGVPPDVPLHKWLKSLTSDLEHEGQLLFFQVLYTCYVLEKGKFYYGLQKENMFVKHRASAKHYVVLVGDIFYEFTTMYELKVGHLPDSPPQNNDLSYVLTLFEKTNIVTDTSLESTLTELATKLRLHTNTPFLDKQAEFMGIRDQFLLQHNVQPFAFQPVQQNQPETLGTVKQTPAPKQPRVVKKPREILDPENARYQEITQKQARVRAEIKKRVV